jgi:hypothetical protein
MISAVELLIDHLVEHIRAVYARDYGILKPEFANIAAWATRMALQNIRNSDALYHNVEHTAMVVQVGLDIIGGKQIREGGVSPDEWLNFTVALACHDIGYVRGVLRGDRPDAILTGRGNETITLAEGATDAALGPHHVDRSQQFVRERFSGHPVLDAERICQNIEYTRFPVPESDEPVSPRDSPGLVRAADLIGQMADPRYLVKLPALFHEFEETGANATFGYKSPEDLRRAYPRFFWKLVRPYIGDALAYLGATSLGALWVANLQAVIFAAEHIDDTANVSPLPFQTGPRKAKKV